MSKIKIGEVKITNRTVIEVNPNDLILLIEDYLSLKGKNVKIPEDHYMTIGWSSGIYISFEKPIKWKNS